MTHPTRNRLVRTLCALVIGVSACSGGSGQTADVTGDANPITTAVPIKTETTSTTVQTEVTGLQRPPVEGPEPSPKIVAFYYPWYGTPEYGGVWDHWDQEQADPPGDIGSDYYPVLGAYNAHDPLVVAQHFAWLRKSGVGVIATSWWGPGNNEDRVVDLLLETAETYGLQVAFHIEPYADRNAANLVRDIEYLYERYGDHPAFYRTAETSLWGEGGRSQGLFFVWSSGRPNGDSEFVEPGYWSDALDAIHALPEGGLVIADSANSTSVSDGHFDGVYQYATLDREPDFSWARTLPPGGWYVPSVIPGLSAKRIAYDEETYTPRDDGQTYRHQWDAALSTGIEPPLITITSFNEWHEGTQIEPAASGARRATGESYDSYGDLGPEGYLELTAALVADYLGRSWDAQTAGRIRIRVETSSDWTTLTLVSGGAWIQPEIGPVGQGGSIAWEGARMGLFQDIDDAVAGRVVQVVFEVGVLEMGEAMLFRIERGGLGYTEVTMSGLADGEETGSSTARWGGWSDDLADGEAGRNPFEFEVAPADLDA